jgi:GTP pyrophosphokinase
VTLNLKDREFDREQKQLILKAIDFATLSHQGQKRYSGEPYISHPIEVGNILSSLGLDSDTIIAGVLHDVLEDTTASHEDIKNLFGESVLHLVQGVTKLKTIHFLSREEEQAEYFRRMLFAMAKDIRVILIKLADRLHNMRTAHSLPTRERQLRMAQETIEIYAPLASRLGLNLIKSELEDLYLKTVKPEEYSQLKSNFASKISERQKMVKKICSDIKMMLSTQNIFGIVEGRPKHFYSIYKKMINKNKEFAEIFDLTAVRVIVSSKEECYSVLGALHHAWTPIPGRFKDYISLPKANNYQSLHTTVMTEFGTPFEIQIRTKDMHKIAEYGIAAHWKYKENISNSYKLDDKLGVLRTVLAANSDAQSSLDFFESFKKDFFADQVYVFTPKGDVVELPLGSTPIDFAYSVHSAVGNKCVGAKVNNKIVPLDAMLKTGDYIDILTQSNSKGPSRDWLRFVKSSQARSKIRAFFKKEMKQDNIQKGKEILELESKQKGIVWSVLCEPKWLESIMVRQGINNLDDLYATVGYGGLTAQQVVGRLIEFAKADKPAITNKKIKSNNYQSGTSDILIRGQADLFVVVAKCCKPVPGDEIIGFISRGKGIAVHRATCVNLKGVEQFRLIEAEWNNCLVSGFIATVQVEAQNTETLLVKISTIISENKLSIRHINLRPQGEKAVVILSVQVSDVVQANSLINKLNTLQEVIKVFRI